MLNDFKRGMEVMYVATHARPPALRDGRDWVEAARQMARIPGTIGHIKEGKEPGIEIGVVSSINDEFVFVKYWPKLGLSGWEYTTSQPTRPNDLMILCDISDFDAPELLTPGVT